ncbi:MAG TPA: chemotaxis protein CheB [Allosphingosinicella sp.]
MSPPAAAAPRPRPFEEESVAPIRVAVVDDSAIARAVLSRMIASQPGLEVVAQAKDAEEALRVLSAVRTDVILLDVEMPGASGIEALPDIIAAGRGAKVLVVSCLCESGAEAAVAALARGAADTLPKPGVENFGGRFSAVLAERIRRLARPEPPAPPAARPPFRLRPMPEGRLGCLAVGASTGGLHAITDYLKALPPRIGAPLLVTQHLPGLFMPFFARQIETAAGRPTRIAEDGLVLAADEVVLAPGDAHIGLEQRGSRVVVALDRAAAASGCLPSVDVMLGAVASVYGRSGLGVVMSGMGRDGLAGSGALAERGGAVIVQDRDSSAVWGMPRGIAEAGLASAVLPPAGLARRTALRLGSRG